MPKTLLAAIAKNEGPYIREWSLYHKMVCGFSDIVVYDNDSADETRNELERLEKEGVVTWKDWPRSRHNPPQQLAYRDATSRKDDYDWICFLDIDEFLVLKGGELVCEFVSKFDDDVGSISFNWLVFYSKEKFRTNEPVTQRVVHCEGRTAVKTIARSKAVVRHGIHAFWLRPGYRYMHCSGKEYKPDEVAGVPLDVKMCRVPGCCMFDVSTAQINHYSMKSKEEVFEKDARGDATVKEHVEKDGKRTYASLVARKDHQENHSIERYIDARAGLARFYEKVAESKPNHASKEKKGMKFITVNGLSRSGNHAIIRWMVGQYEDSGYEVFFHNNAIKNFMEHLNLRGGGGMHGLPIPNPKFIDILMHITRNEKKVFIVSFEDLVIDERLGQLTEFADHNVVILRDPYNLFASRIQGLLPPRGRKGATKVPDLQEAEIKKYISQHQEFTGESSHLKNKVCISYNSWVADADYRKKTSESLGAKFTDARYRQRACSSFGPKSPIELPSEKPEDFLTRYKACWDDPLFKRIRESEELSAISKKVFGLEASGGA